MSLPTAQMRVANKKQAKIKLEDLFLKLQKEVLNSSAVMVISGPKAKELAETAEKEFDVYTFDANELTKSIAKEIPPTNYMGRALNPSTVDIASALLETVAMNIGVSSYNPLIWRNSMAGSVIKSQEDLEAELDRLISDFAGYEIVSAYFINKVASKVIEEDYQGSTVPVMITVEDETKAKKITEQTKRLTSKTFLITTNEESQNEALFCKSGSKNAVKEVLTKVKQSLKKED